MFVILIDEAMEAPTLVYGPFQSVEEAKEWFVGKDWVQKAEQEWHGESRDRSVTHTARIRPVFTP